VSKKKQKQKKPKGKMRALDLFSGVGGLALALLPFVEHVGYCEIDAYCRRVLAARMREHALPRAPVHDDVRTLHAAALCPSIVVGGFPCQDVSTLGARAGMDGARSSLFFEIARVVDEAPSVVAVFLENVSNIAACGGEDVVRALAARGFAMRWTMRAASDEGAPHVRLRWFVLAVRGDGARRVSEAVAGHALETGPWPAEPETSVTPREEQGADWAKRMGALGNAVVPRVARNAFVELAASTHAWHACASMLCAEELTHEIPRGGMLVDGKLYALPHGGARSARYPTPRSANVYPTTRGGARTETLSTILVHEAAPDAPHGVLPDARYVEWMMGFPRDWTLAPEREAAAAAASASSAASAEPRPRARPNGLHMFMRECPGHNVSAASALWRALTPARRAEYSAAARRMD
jgi:DNA (cytosine-5)-methyltransferase 1